MTSHCMKDRPFEACGLLSGKGGRCETIWPMINVEKSPYSFAISDEAIEKAMAQMKERGEALTGIYHSHPTALPYPSKEDQRHNGYPTVAYFIVSLQGREPVVRCFQVTPSKVQPIKIIQT